MSLYTIETGSSLTQVDLDLDLRQDYRLGIAIDDVYGAGYASVTLTPAQARELRDYLIENYPLDEGE